MAIIHKIIDTRINEVIYPVVVDDAVYINGKNNTLNEEIENFPINYMPYYSIMRNVVNNFGEDWYICDGRSYELKDLDDHGDTVIITTPNIDYGYIKLPENYEITSIEIINAIVIETKNSTVKNDTITSVDGSRRYAYLTILVNYDGKASRTFNDVAKYIRVLPKYDLKYTPTINPILIGDTGLLSYEYLNYYHDTYEALPIYYFYGEIDSIEITSAIVVLNNTSKVENDTITAPGEYRDYVYITFDVNYSNGYSVSKFDWVAFTSVYATNQILTRFTKTLIGDTGIISYTYQGKSDTYHSLPVYECIVLNATAEIDRAIVVLNSTSKIENAIITEYTESRNRAYIRVKVTYNPALHISPYYEYFNIECQNVMQLTQEEIAYIESMEPDEMGIKKKNVNQKSGQIEKEFYDFGILTHEELSIVYKSALELDDIVPDNADNIVLEYYIYNTPYTMDHSNDSFTLTYNSIDASKVYIGNKSYICATFDDTNSSLYKLYRATLDTSISYGIMRTLTYNEYTKKYLGGMFTNFNNGGSSQYPDENGNRTGTGRQKAWFQTDLKFDENNKCRWSFIPTNPSVGPTSRRWTTGFCLSYDSSYIYRGIFNESSQTNSDYVGLYYTNAVNPNTNSLTQLNPPVNNDHNFPNYRVLGFFKLKEINPLDDGLYVIICNKNGVSPKKTSIYRITKNNSAPIISLVLNLPSDSHLSENNILYYVKFKDYILITTYSTEASTSTSYPYIWILKSGSNSIDNNREFSQDFTINEISATYNISCYKIINSDYMSKIQTVLRNIPGYETIEVIPEKISLSTYRCGFNDNFIFMNLEHENVGILLASSNGINWSYISYNEHDGTVIEDNGYIFLVLLTSDKSYVLTGQGWEECISRTFTYNIDSSLWVRTKNRYSKYTGNEWPANNVNNTYYKIVKYTNDIVPYDTVETDKPLDTGQYALIIQNDENEEGLTVKSTYLTSNMGKWIEGDVSNGILYISPLVLHKLFKFKGYFDDHINE